MLTKNDKKFISDSISENSKVLIREMIDLFNTTNERIDQSNVRIDRVLKQLKDHNDILDNHEYRLDKVEDKVFAA